MYRSVADYRSHKENKLDEENSFTPSTGLGTILTSHKSNTRE